MGGCRWRGGRATAEPTSFRTIVHETGHVIFGLPDEYCCDSSYRVVEPVLYDSEADCTGDAANASWRNCESFTSSRDQSEWWRSQGDIDTNLIMLNTGDPVWESGPADWVVMEAVYDGLGGTPVVPPSVFAPTTWDNPTP